MAINLSIMMMVLFSRHMVTVLMVVIDERVALRDVGVLKIAVLVI
jgi:hypothetical protein